MSVVVRRVCAKCGVDVDPLGCERCAKCGHDTYKPVYEEIKHPRERWLHPKDFGAVLAVVIGVGFLVLLALVMDR